MTTPKMKTLEINCNKLLLGKMHSNGRYCSVGFYARKVKDLPVNRVESFNLSKDCTKEEEQILSGIMNINDNEKLTWKTKAKEITKLFKKLNIKVVWKNAPWKK